MEQQHFLPYGGECGDIHPRRAALLLHALPERDRHWLLTQLLPARREMLRTLLLELRELGIPADQAWLRDVISSGTSRTRELNSVPHEVGTAPSDSRQTALEQASAMTLAEVLRDESPGAIARLLALQSWPWAGAFMELLSTIKRRQVEDIMAHHHCGKALQSADYGSALREQLVAGVLRRLDAYGVRGAIDTGGPHAVASLPIAVEGFWRRRFRQFVHQVGSSVLPSNINR